MAIEVGAQGPATDRTFEDAEGQPHSLAAALDHGPLLLGLYKSSCQASKTMFPFLQRLYERYGDKGLTVYGVAQDSPNITRSFARRLGITFPILIEPDGYPLSNAFAIAATPTIYLLNRDGTVAYTTMGFLKPGLDAMGEAVANALGEPAAPLVTEADADVPMFVPG
ncbi:MAG TPA: TlpA disulfide reductase family protein [Thermomicrobiales bacterium]|nr:TlpA disulfide reductase family protein [Thermomicrobiales bacterium]